MSMSYLSEQQSISVPIPESFRQIALEFAQEQPISTKAKQVYLNTLAVQVVNSYLAMLDIPTELEASYSWHPRGRLTADVADLLLTGVGRLECLPMRTGDRTCKIPPEVWDNRIGYVVVEINHTCKEGKIRGFVTSVNTPEITLEQLRSLTVLIEHLHLVHLRQWLEGIYTNNWQSIEELSSQRSTQLAFRSKRVRGWEFDNPEKAWQVVEQLYPAHSWEKNLPPELLASFPWRRLGDIEVSPTTNNYTKFTEAIAHLLKTTPDEETRWTLAEILWTLAPNHPAVSARRIIDLGMQLAGHPVALMVAILAKPDRNVAVLLRVYPMGNQPYLPPGLQLAGLDENGKSFLEVQARENKDDYIQCKFCAEFGEKFQVRVSMNNVSFTENFVI
ncbi:DUF1822 family protein [Anabaena sp. FACHB-709]|uniref:DUF1822 domain-containing protein n=2 Tax=Nostocaceae TaxID=1162 RepID=A0A1Z4KMB1_ANAVA|nr:MULTISPECIES: DUF1822 family protein [Nostocaceae]BAB76229.1 alr4530 [Nostoc sp. PCC 7120 = FACHB-418]BAY70140.1 hypothetical protein NIES23_29400 [Trichormus variabilis NIES-23]